MKTNLKLNLLGKLSKCVFYALKTFKYYKCILYKNLYFKRVEFRIEQRLQQSYKLQRKS